MSSKQKVLIVDDDPVVTDLVSMYLSNEGFETRIVTDGKEATSFSQSFQPDLIIADEPTTALDVTVQAQIMELISQLKEEREMSIILISHNMGIIAEMCDQMLVMYGGVVVEEGSCKQIFAAPKHPYTIGLLGAIPSVAVDKEELDSIPGIVPKLTPPVVGCRFASRCAHANDRCRAQEPPIFPVEEGHGARCWLHETEEKEEGADE